MKAAAAPISARVERWARSNLDALQQDPQLAGGNLKLRPGDVDKAAKALGLGKAEVGAELLGLEQKLLQNAKSGSHGASVYGSRAPSSQLQGMPSAAAGATLGAHRFSDVQLLSTPQKKELSALQKRGCDAGIDATWRQAPQDPQAAKKAVIADLKEVPVAGPDGVKTNVLDKLMNDPDLALNPSQRERVLTVLSEAKHNFAALEAPGGNYQDINWKHTRGEIDQVMESCKLNKLSPNQTEDAILSSIFSDCVKSPANFITHNVDGAAAASLGLERHFKGGDGLPDKARIYGVTQAVLEHQIGPPKFMSMIMGFVLNGALGDKAGMHQKDIASIQEKIASPLAHRNAKGSEVDFSDDERALLAKAGVEKWSTPHEGAAWSKASRALIDGDSLINYASPDGWAKIAAIRGPGTMFKDATVHDSVHSAKQSYDDAYSVVSEGAKPLAEAGLRRCEGGMQRVSQKIDAWILDQGKRVPRNDEGKVAFWDAPLEYPPNADGSGLGKPAQAAYDFAQELKDQVVQLLRDEQENV